MSVSERRAEYDPVEALRLCHFAISYAGGLVPVYPDGANRASHWCETPNRLVGVTLGLDETEHEATAGTPAAKPGAYPVASSVLWCTIEGSEQERHAHRFKPLPSIVLRAGLTTKRLLLWILSNPVDGNVCEQANKKLAYALHARQARLGLGHLRLWLPGTSFRTGKQKPVPILVTRLSLDDHECEDIVGGLRTPPLPWAVRQRMAKEAAA